MSDQFTPPPSELTPVWVAQRAGQIRTLVAFVGGAMGGTAGAALVGLSVEQIGSFLTTAMMMMSFAGWAWAGFKSWRQKSADRAITVASAQASAMIGQPVIVTVTPPGQLNALTKVSPAEVAAAPSIPNVNPSPPPKEE